MNEDVEVTLNKPMDKSLDELLEEHNKALENISLALNRILTQQEQILSALLPKVEDNQVENG